jgi:N-methylhydantoinase B
MATKQQRYWDGVQRSYIPPDQLEISPKVKLSTDYTPEEDIDPITYEVIRHRLWRAVWDGGLTCARMSVSPIAFITRDLQPSLFLENGDIVFFGPYLQYMSGMLEPAVKWILENRGEDPGINKDDIFLENDPWVGTIHQQDVGTFASIFIDGEIFAWTGMTQHQNDIGGSVAGSFCMNAADIWFDPPPIPPIKIVKGGEIDVQLLDLYKRMSRTPAHLELDLRAAIAGNTLMKNRLLEIVDEYGRKLVKGVMRLIVANSERDYLRKMAPIPDGTWSQTSFIQAAMTGDRKAQRLVVTMEKKGTELFFSNEGTDPQVGAINLSYAGWRGAVMSVLSVILLPEQMGAVGGAMRHLHFNPISGKLICPEFGAAMSPAGTLQEEMGQAMANTLFSKMLLSAREESVRKLAMSSFWGHWSPAIGGGFTATGEFYVAPYGIDAVLGSSPASFAGDGVYGGGCIWVPEGQAANTEENERSYPMLTLWRKMERHSSVPGKFISGEAGLVANTAHDGTHAPVFIVDEESPNTPGIFGLPGSRLKMAVVENTNLKGMFEKGEMPGSLDEIEGQRRKAQPRDVLFGVSMLDLGESNGVFEWSITTCSAMFDPLTREPEKVQKDVVTDRYTKKQAEELFGVVLKPDLSLDLKQTEKKREQMRKERLAKSVTPKGGK